jgi:hypothetical protein
MYEERFYPQEGLVLGERTNTCAQKQLNHHEKDGSDNTDRSEGAICTIMTKSRRTHKRIARNCSI